MILRNINKYFKSSKLVFESLSFTVVYSIQTKKIQVDSFRPLFNIFQGFQVAQFSKSTIILLPGCSLFEKNVAFTNFQGNIKFSNKLLPSKGLAREEDLVLSHFALAVFSIVCNESPAVLLPVNLEWRANHNFSVPGAKTKAKTSFVDSPLFNFYSTKSSVNKSIFLTTVTNFYNTDSVSSLSKNLAVCGANSKVFFITL